MRWRRSYRRASSLSPYFAISEEVCLSINKKNHRKFFEDIQAVALENNAKKIFDLQEKLRAWGISV